MGVGRLTDPQLTDLPAPKKKLKPRESTRHRARAQERPPKNEATPRRRTPRHRPHQRPSPLWRGRTPARAWGNPLVSSRTSDSIRWPAPPLSEEPYLAFPPFPGDTPMTDSTSGLLLSSGSTLQNLQDTGPPASSEFRSNFQQLFGDRADSRVADTVLLDTHGRSAITPAPRGQNDYSPRDRRGRPPVVHRPRTRAPAPDRTKNLDKAPARSSRELVWATF